MVDDPYGIQRAAIEQQLLSGVRKYLDKDSLLILHKSGGVASVGRVGASLEEYRQLLAEEQLDNTLLDFNIAMKYGVKPSDITEEFLERVLKEHREKMQEVLKAESVELGHTLVSMEEVVKEADRLDETIRALETRLAKNVPLP